MCVCVGGCICVCVYVCVCIHEGQSSKLHPVRRDIAEHFYYANTQTSLVKLEKLEISHFLFR